MAKATKITVSDEAPASSGEEAFVTGPVESDLPDIFRQAVLAWGANPDYWQIWLKNAYYEWKAGGPAPEGDLSECLGKKKLDEQNVSDVLK